VIPGEAIALLRIPAFGSDYEVPILSGTDLAILDRGVGHYTTTAMPGEVGNFALAGHRVTHGEPFRRLLELDEGDQVIVETRDKIHTYVMDGSPGNLTVNDTETWVLDPDPHHPGAEATEAVLTLTTCQDLFHSPDRSVGFAHLTKTVDKP
jgi:sortase A